MNFRDRIKEFRRVKASSLIPNPRNWRTHPESQANALRAMLQDVGIVGALLVRETPEGLQIIDGHLRADTMPDMEVPVLVLDVTEEEANKILATFDPIGAMAEADAKQLAELYASITFDDEALVALASFESQDCNAELPEPSAGSYCEQYGVIVICADEAAQQSAYESLVADGYECRVVVT